MFSMSMRGKWDSVAFGLGVAVLVLDTLLVEHLRHLLGNIFEFLRVRDDVEFFFLLLRIVRLGFLSLCGHGAFSAYGSEQSRMNPQLRQISLQCTASMGKPQMSQRSPSGGATEGRSA